MKSWWRCTSRRRTLFSSEKAANIFDFLSAASATVTLQSGPQETDQGGAGAAQQGEHAVRGGG